MTNVEELKGLLERATKGPLKFQRLDGYEENARILKRELGEHEGYFRDNSGDWIIGDEQGRFAAVTFKGKAKRGQTWNAPDPEGQANAQLIVAAVNALPALLLERERLREACKKALTCGLDSSVRELVASALRGERTP